MSSPNGRAGRRQNVPETRSGAEALHRRLAAKWGSQAAPGVPLGHLCYNPGKESSGMPADVRPSPISGTWYPGTAEGLIQSVDRQLEQAAVSPIPGTIIGVIAPHAGHVYSGPVAAHAFRLLRGLQPRVVAVVSPLHVAHRGEGLTAGATASA